MGSVDVLSGLVVVSLLVWLVGWKGKRIEHVLVEKGGRKLTRKHVCARWMRVVSLVGLGCGVVEVASMEGAETVCVCWRWVV